MIIFLIKSTPYLNYKKCNNIARSFLIKRLSYFFPNALIQKEEEKKDFEENDIIFELSTSNPFIDIDLIKKAIKKIDFNLQIKTNGFISGTTFLKCYLGGEDTYRNNTKIKIIHSNLNEKYNTQFNLLKLKRQKIFKFIITKEKNIYKKSIKDILKFFSSKKGLKLVLQYGEDVELTEHKYCPYCKSKNIKKLFLTNGHPVIGFITNKISFYSHCEECLLIFLKYVFPENKLYLIYDNYENERDINKKDLNHISIQNTSHYENYFIAFNFINNLPKEVNLLDLGCGGCEFLSLARNNKNIRSLYGMDFNITTENKTFLSSNNISYFEGDFINHLPNKKFDIITLWEVIEHIYPNKLDSFINNIFNRLNDNGYLILSTPDYDALYSKLFDFWAAFPIHHLTVLSKSWLFSFFDKNNTKIIEEHHEGVCIKQSSAWFNYYEKIYPDNIYLNILNKIHQDYLLNESLNHHMRTNNCGSEIILIIQKVKNEKI